MGNRDEEASFRGTSPERRSFSSTADIVRGEACDSKNERMENGRCRSRLATPITLRIVSCYLRLETIAGRRGLRAQKTKTNARSWNWS